MANNTKMKKWLPVKKKKNSRVLQGKHHPMMKVENVAVKPFVQTSKRSTEVIQRIIQTNNRALKKLMSVVPQQFQQNDPPEYRRAYLRDLQVWLLSNGMVPQLDSQETHKLFKWMILAKTLPAWNKWDRDSTKWKGDFGPWSSDDRKQTDNYTAANTSFSSWKKKDNSESRIKSPRSKVKSHGESFPGRSRIEP